MKMYYPGKRFRRRLYDTLEDFFNGETTKKEVIACLKEFAKFYELSSPKVVWKNGKLAKGDAQGFTYEDGVIVLIEPHFWKTNSSYSHLTCRDWVDTVVHEMGHYIMWADCERKANRFEKRMRADL